MERIEEGSRVALRNGRWEVGSHLGEGGFCAVYRARRDDGVEGAIKFIPKDPGAKRELLFVELSGIDGVIPIIDDGETEESWLLAMPEADRSLRQHMERSDGISIEEAVEIARNIASALDQIREQGVVHRDIKPENILLLDGKWCLADFGISRYIDATTSVNTRKYSMTPQYAAPEQWLAKHATSATDIYALGIIIYEMITGERPFSGPMREDYREQHLHNTPAPFSGDVPPGLAVLAIDCLSKPPGGRPSAKVFLHRLSKVQPVREGGLAALQRASVREAFRRAEATRDQEHAKTAADLRDELSICGYGIYDRITSEVVGAIEDAVSGIRKSTPELRKIGDDVTLSLGDAELVITRTPRRFEPSNSDAWRLPFDVVLYGRILLSIPADYRGFRGKANSLWYCDAEDEGEYAWYELGFMPSGLYPQREFDRQPEELPPLEAAAKALALAVTEYQVAWPVTRLDAGDMHEFIDRWAGWFGQAVDGTLHRPSRRPEVEMKRNWRG